VTGEGGQYGGGRPPSLEALAGAGGTTGAGREGDVEWNTDQVILFMFLLFYRYQQVPGANSQELQMLLTASILLRLPQVLECLKQHPLKMYGTTDEDCFKKHRFLVILLRAANGAKITNPIVVMKKWAVLIERDFYRRNYMFAPMKDLQRTLGGQGFVCDTRSMATFMKTSAQETGALRQELLQTNYKLRRLTEENVEIKRMLYENEISVNVIKQELYENKQQMAMLIRLVQGKQAVLTAPLQPVLPAAPVTPANAASPSLRMFALRAPPCVQGLTVKGVFLAWHSDGYNISLHDPDASKSVRSLIKICVEYLTLFLKEHIDGLPATATCGALAPIWRGRLEVKTNSAWEAAEAFAKTKGTSKLSTSLNTFKTFMYIHTSELPEGPTGNSAFQPPDTVKPLRTKTELVAEKKKKRKPPPTSPQQQEEGNKRSRTDTTGTGATEAVTGTGAVGEQEAVQQPPPAQPPVGSRLV
jgi:hypothetical protein